MSRGAFIVLAAVLLLGLSACQSPEQACEESGGTYTFVRTQMVTTFINTGKVMIPVVNTIPVYECHRGGRV